MDDPTFAERRGYSNIQFAPNLRRRISIFTSHFSRGVLLLTVALASVALFSIKYITTDHHVYVPLATASYGLWVTSISDAVRSFATNNAYVPKAWNRAPSRAVSQYMRKPLVTSWRPRLDASDWRSRSLSLLSRPETACSALVEDFVEDREVWTGDCNGGRTCRARVIVTKQGPNITIQAGYNIRYPKGVIGVDARTKRNVRAVKRSEANRWAKKLVKMVGPILEGLDCNIAAGMISDAIMETKSAAARCPKTNNPLCTQLKTIKTCAVAQAPPPQTERENECIEFLSSEPAISSLHDLSTKSPCPLRFEYNGVFMWVPLCETNCVNNSCVQEKTIFGELDISGFLVSPRYVSSDNVAIRDSMAAVYVPLYNTLIGANFPRCDNMSYGVLEPEFEIGEEEYELLVASRPSSYCSRFAYTIPKDIQDMAAENHGGIVLDVRYKIAKSPAEYVDSECSAAV